MSKRKANNPQRRLERLGKAVLKNCAITFVAGGNGLCAMVDLKTNRAFKPLPALANAIESGRYIWSVYCAVFCRDQAGVEYMQGVEVVTNEPCYQADLLNVLQHHHIALLDGCNEAHKVNVGWLASAVGHEWREKEAGKIFTNLNAWDFLAKWETAGGCNE